MHPDAHYSIIYNSQVMMAIVNSQHPMVDEWIKKILVCAHTQ